MMIRFNTLVPILLLAFRNPPLITNHFFKLVRKNTFSVACVTGYILIDVVAHFFHFGAFVEVIVFFGLLVFSVLLELPSVANSTLTSITSISTRMINITTIEPSRKPAPKPRLHITATKSTRNNFFPTDG